MTQAEARRLRTIARCLKAFDKLKAMHYRCVSDWNSYCTGRRIMAAVRRVRARARRARNIGRDAIDI